MYFCFYTVYFYIVQLSAIGMRSLNATRLLACLSVSQPTERHGQLTRCFSAVAELFIGLFMGISFSF